MKRVLEVLDIPIFMALGCSQQEQANPQKVLISIKFSLEEYVKCERSDAIEDTINYATVAEFIEQICAEKPYHLIEHASAKIYSLLKERYPNTSLQIRFVKVNPPHRLLQGGTAYTLGDNDL